MIQNVSLPGTSPNMCDYRIIGTHPSSFTSPKSGRLFTEIAIDERHKQRYPPGVVTKINVSSGKGSVSRPWQVQAAILSP